MDVKITTISDRITVELALQGKRLPWLAEKTGIGRNALKDRLQGRVDYSLGDIAAISNALDLDASELSTLYFAQGRSGVAA